MARLRRKAEAAVLRRADEVAEAVPAHVQARVEKYLTTVWRDTPAVDVFVGLLRAQKSVEQATLLQRLAALLSSRQLSDLASRAISRVLVQLMLTWSSKNVRPLLLRCLRTNAEAHAHVALAAIRDELTSMFELQRVPFDMDAAMPWHVALAQQAPARIRMPRCLASSRPGEILAMLRSLMDYLEAGFLDGEAWTWRLLMFTLFTMHACSCLAACQTEAIMIAAKLCSVLLRRAARAAAPSASTASSAAAAAASQVAAVAYLHGAVAGDADDAPPTAAAAAAPAPAPPRGVTVPPERVAALATELDFDVLLHYGHSLDSFVAPLFESSLVRVPASPRDHTPSGPARGPQSAAAAAATDALATDTFAPSTEQRAKVLRVLFDLHAFFLLLVPMPRESNLAVGLSLVGAVADQAAMVLPDATSESSAPLFDASLRWCRALLTQMRYSDGPSRVLEPHGLQLPAPFAQVLGKLHIVSKVSLLRGLLSSLSVAHLLSTLDAPTTAAAAATAPTTSAAAASASSNVAALAQAAAASAVSMVSAERGAARRPLLLTELNARFMSLCRSSRDTHVRFFALQCVASWLERSRSLLSGEMTDEVLEVLLAQFSQMNELVWHFWSDASGFIGQQVRLVFEGMIELLNYLGWSRPVYQAACKAYFDQTLAQLIGFDWVKKAKFQGLVILMSKVRGVEILRLQPDFMHQLLAVSIEDRQNKHVPMLVEAFLTTLLQDFKAAAEPSSGTERRVLRQWADVWVDEVLAALLAPSHLSDCVSVFVLPSLMKVHEHVATLLLERLLHGRQATHLPIEAIRCAVSILKAAKIAGHWKWGDTFEFLSSSDLVHILHTALMDEHEDARNDALDAISFGSKISDPFDFDELLLMQKFLRHCIKITSAKGRQRAYAALRKFFERVDEFAKVMQRKKVPTKVASAFVSLNTWLTHQIKFGLGPAVSFQRKLMSMMLVQLHRPTFLRPSIVPLLIDCLADNVEQTRVLACDTLLAMPTPLPGYADAPAVAGLLNRGVVLGSSRKFGESEGGAFVFRIVCQKYVRELHWTVSWLPSGQFAVSSEPAQPSTPVPRGATSADASLASEESALLQFLGAVVRAVDGEIDSRRAHLNLVHGLFKALRMTLPSVPMTLGHLVRDRQRWSDVMLSLIVAMRRTSFTGLYRFMITGPDGVPVPQASELMRTIMPDLTAAQDELIDGTQSREMLILLRLHAWHSLREIGLLCGTLVTVHDTDSLTALFSAATLDSLGDLSMRLVLSTQHNGVIEKSFLGLSQICAKLLPVPQPEYMRLPSKWLDELLHVVSRTAGRTVLRRSAGIPFAFCAVLGAEAPSSVRRLLPTAVEHLLNMARKPLESDEYPHEQVHALNIIRSLFHQSAIALDMLAFLEPCLHVTMQGFLSPSWAIRNSSMMLLHNVMARALNSRNSSGSVSSSEFFARFSSMHSRFLEILEADTLIGKCSDASFAVLLLLSRLGPPDVATDATRALLKAIAKFASAPDHQIRDCAGMATVALVPRDSTAAYVSHMFATLASALPGNHNAANGCLLRVLGLLRFYRAMDELVFVEMSLCSLYEIDGLLTGSAAVRAAILRVPMLSWAFLDVLHACMDLSGVLDDLPADMRSRIATFALNALDGDDGQALWSSAAPAPAMQSPEPARPMMLRSAATLLSRMVLASPDALLGAMREHVQSPTATRLDLHDLFLRLLRDPDDQVRLAALESLRRYPSLLTRMHARPIIDHLLGVTLPEEPVSSVTKLALRVLSTIACLERELESLERASQAHTRQSASRLMRRCASRFLPDSHVAHSTTAEPQDAAAVTAPAAATSLLSEACLAHGTALVERLLEFCTSATAPKRRAHALAFLGVMMGIQSAPSAALLKQWLELIDSASHEDASLGLRVQAVRSALLCSPSVWKNSPHMWTLLLRLLEDESELVRSLASETVSRAINLRVVPHESYSVEVVVQRLIKMACGLPGDAATQALAFCIGQVLPSPGRVALIQNALQRSDASDVLVVADAGDDDANDGDDQDARDGGDGGDGGGLDDASSIFDFEEANILKEPALIAVQIYEQLAKLRPQFKDSARQQLIAASTERAFELLDASLATASKGVSDSELSSPLTCTMVFQVLLGVCVLGVLSGREHPDERLLKIVQSAEFELVARQFRSVGRIQRKLLGQYLRFRVL